eukprot:1206643-Rhodomonas_salina.1
MTSTDVVWKQCSRCAYQCSRYCYRVFCAPCALRCPVLTQRVCYAVCGCAMRCPVLTQSVQRGGGSDSSQKAQGGDGQGGKWTEAMESGETGYVHTGVLCEAWYWRSVCGKRCAVLSQRVVLGHRMVENECAMRGTEPAYGGMRCAVLSWRMARDARYA